MRNRRGVREIPANLSSRLVRATSAGGCYAARERGPARWPFLVLCGALLGIWGCPQPHFELPAPRTREEALQRVNANLSRIDRPLQAAGSVSFQFKDSENKRHHVPGQDARLEYQPPRGLLFDVRSLSGTVAEFGATPERFWLWVDLPDFKKMWWGEWAHVGPGIERRLPIPPNDLFDALLLRPLPETSPEGGLRPLLRIAGPDYRLLFVRLAAGGQPTGWREIRLDPQPPYQPIEIVDRAADGDVLMEAQLSNYQRVGGADGPYTPRRYVVRWPASEAQMNLDISRAKFLEGPREPVEFPAGWKAELERVDTAAPEGGRPARSEVRPPPPPAVPTTQHAGRS